MSSGYLKPEDALKLLLIGPEYTQVAIKTEKALKQLHFIKSEKVEWISDEQLKAERSSYQEAFGKELKEIMNS